jgi:hypothetical protein
MMYYTYGIPPDSDEYRSLGTARPGSGHLRTQSWTQPGSRQANRGGDVDWKDDRGIALVGILITVGAIAIVFYLLNRSFGTPQEQVPVPEDVCGCRDLYEMESRVQEATAAIAAINGLSQAQLATPNGAATMYTPAQYNQGVDATQPDVSAARRAGARSGSAKTDSNCKPKFDSYSKCLEAGLKAHENVHIRECRAYTDKVKATGQSGPADWKEAKTMVDYWAEDVSAYQAEIDYLNRQIARVKADPECKPKVSTYPGAESKEEQQQRLAGSKRRVTKYAKTIG